MTPIEIPEAAVCVANAAYDSAIARGGTTIKAMNAALTAAMGVWVGPELDEYQRLRDGVGGCTDGGCVIKRPTGMHTNGGCKCWQDKIKAQRMMRAGQKLFDTLRQEKPE